MRVGYDISQTGALKAGCGYYAHALLEGVLAINRTQELQLYTSFGDFYLDPRMAVRSPYRGEGVSYGPRHVSRDSAADFWNHPDLEIRLRRPDIVHSNNFWCPLQLRDSRLVYTFYDLGFVSNPDWTTEANRTGCFQGVFSASIRADLIVAISEASRRHYLDVFPHFPEERIRVIHPASRFVTASLKPVAPATVDPSLAGRFWLAVGTIEPRKNQLRLAEAYARYRERVRDPIPLVLAGGAGWLMEDFVPKLRALGVAEHVIMTGYISDNELAWLYGNCHVNLYPSLFEGFGMPVLEAMTFGAATIAAETSSIPEAAGDAAILINPLDTEAWTAAMIELSAHSARRRELGQAALRHARKFSWEVSARALLQAYQDVCRMPRRAFV